MNNTCENDECTNGIKHTGKRFCSLQCANSHLAKYRKKIAQKNTKICKLPSCSQEFSPVDSRKVFCSRSCAATYNNTKHPKKAASTLWNICPGCDNRVYNKKFCTKSCRQDYEIRLWIAGEIDGNTAFGVRSFVKIYLERRSGNQCEGTDLRFNARCTETRSFHIDHIDGNWRNTTHDNLQYICPTCHSLTPTYGSKNKQLGRPWKQVYNTPRIYVSGKD